jgi:hypothetical protein
MLSVNLVRSLRIRDKVNLQATEYLHKDDEATSKREEE